MPRGALPGDKCSSSVLHMGLIDFILNLAGLLLCLDWRGHAGSSSRLAPPATLAGTLRRADAPRLRRWQFPPILALLLFLRAVVYWQIGPAVGWTGVLQLGVISVSFRSDYFWWMVLFSTLSFGLTLGIFMMWLLFLSLMRPRSGESFPFQQFIRANLGFVDAWPTGLKLALPFLGASLLWWLASWLLAAWGILPHPASELRRLQQAAVIGAGSYVAWSFVIYGVLLLHLLNSYIYFGQHSFWGYINAVAQRVLRPLRVLPLRFARIDFAPLIALAIVFAAARCLEGGVNLPGPHQMPGLRDLYQKLTL